MDGKVNIKINQRISGLMILLFLYIDIKYYTTYGFKYFINSKIFETL